MKQIVIMGALLLLAAGCSKNKVEVINDPLSQEEAWVNDLSLPVPIQFSSSSMMSTKATPSGPIEGTVMDNLEIGVFALAVQYDNESSQYTQTWNGRNPESILLANEHAVTDTDGNIKFDETKYYPLDNDYTYSFYAYYPHTTDNLQTVDNYYRVTFDLGYTDILYAHTDAKTLGTEQKTGYNASYMRFLKSNADWVTMYWPKLTFTHLLTSLQIKVNTTAEETSSMRVQSVTLRNTYSQAYLYVADSRSQGSNVSGQLQGVGAKTGSITLTDGKDTDFSDIELSGTGSVLSQFLVLPDSEYTIDVTYGLYNGSSIENPTTTSGTISIGRGFEARHRYNVNITLDEVETIDIKCEMIDWDDDTPDVAWTPSGD